VGSKRDGDAIAVLVFSREQHETFPRNNPRELLPPRPPGESNVMVPANTLDGQNRDPDRPLVVPVEATLAGRALAFDDAVRARRRQRMNLVTPPNSMKLNSPGSP
jgi:hypothetical protein